MLVMVIQCSKQKHRQLIILGLISSKIFKDLGMESDFIVSILL